MIPVKGYTKFTTSSNDSRFPSFLRGFNMRWLANNCEAVYTCYNTKGTVAALEDAIQHYGKNVKIKSGGHCYEDFVFSGDTKAIIDVTPMNETGFNPVRGYFLGSGGTNWSAFKALFRDYGKVLPAGSCYSVGLGGHICGGGYGVLSRLNGLTVDWLTGVEVVVKEGSDKPARAIYVSNDAATAQKRDLFWAHCGGGGGNFGVITKYYFKALPDAPKQAFVTGVVYQWTQLNDDKTLLGRLLNWYALFAARTDNWRQFGLFHLKHEASGSIQLTIQTAVLNGEDAGVIYQNFIQPVLNQLNAIAPYTLIEKNASGQIANLYLNRKDTNLYTIYEAVQLLNGSGSNQRGKYKSAYMRKGFPPEQVQAIMTALTTIPVGLEKSDMQQTLLQVDSYGGMINTVSSEATAVPQRSSILKLQFQTYWQSADQDKLHLEWISGFYENMYAKYGGTPDPDKDRHDNNVDGCYYNYPDADLNGTENNKDLALHLYFLKNLPRLKRIKKRWDPENYFNNAQSIPVG